MNSLFMFVLFFVAIGIGLIVLWFVLDKISARFSLMPSTDALILSIIYFGMTYYLVFDVFNSFVVGIALVCGIAGILKLIESFKLNNLEAIISNDSSLTQIIDLHTKRLNGAYNIAKVLKLKSRKDYNIIMPQIIENLKNRNKLPMDITVVQGEIFDDSRV